MGGSHFPLVSFPLPTAKELTQKRRCNGITWPQPEGAGVPGGVWEGLKWLSRGCQPHYSLFSWIYRLQEAIGGDFVRTFDLSMVDSISQTSANQGNRFPVFSQFAKIGNVSGRKNSKRTSHPTFFSSHPTPKITPKGPFPGKFPVKLKHCVVLLALPYHTPPPL